MDCQKKHLWCFGQEAEAKAQAMCKAIRQALRRWKGVFFLMDQFIHQKMRLTLDAYGR